VIESGKFKNQIGKQFNIPPSTLLTLLKNKDDSLREYETYKGTMKRMKFSI
jgi:hypothetical protein